MIATMKITPLVYTFVAIIFALQKRSLADGSLFFPFGLGEGDEFLPANDDGSTAELPISINFPFFDHDHQSLYVNNNGLLSFLGPIFQFTSDPFPLGDGRRIIAPFWADINTDVGGTLSYREVLRFDLNDDMFRMADEIVRETFVEMRHYVSSWMYIATWDEVSFFGSHNSAINNSFQAVLLTDGRYSFTIFNYGDISWTSGTASGGNSTGLGGIPAQVGFNAGDGVTQYSVPGSRTAQVVDIEWTSNIGVPGRWVFRIDNVEVDPHECTPEGKASLFPLVGTMLGGTQVLVSGPCFDFDSEVVCRFDEERVSGVRFSETSAMCVSPTFFKTGQIPLAVSVDGGSIFDFHAVFAILNVEDVPSRVHSAAVGAPEIVEVFTVEWDTEALLNVELVDVVLFGYEESANTAGVRFEQMLTLASEVEYVVGEQMVTVSHDPSWNAQIGAIAVIKSGVPVNSTSLAAILWSEVHVLQWLYGHDQGEWCVIWEDEETGKEHDFVAVRPPCPCTLDQALVDVGRFAPHPDCDFNSILQENCADREAAVHCVRAIEPSELGGGQECCYDLAGFILNLELTDSAGYSHRYHHSGVQPYQVAGQVPYLSHFMADVLPWSYCVLWGESPRYRNIFARYRPSHVCQNYVPPPSAIGNGDPHIATLDSVMYTFNGHGEFTFLSGRNDTFRIQARLAAMPDVEATVIVAVAASFGESDDVHVQLSERRVLDAYVRSEDGSGERNFVRVDFEQAPRWTFAGVYLSGGNISGNGIVVVFEGGAGLELKASQGAMSIVTTVPNSFRGETRGLMGTWNGDPSDDFLTPNGDILPANLTTEELHYEFGLLWEVTANESLFYYELGTDHESHTDRDFVPVFEPTGNPAVNQTLVEEVCGTNQFCIFDFQTTGQESFARETVQTITLYEEAVENREVVACPALPDPVDGSAIVTRYSEGGVATFTCNPGYELTDIDVTLTCQHDGTWSEGEVPGCVAVPVTPAKSAIPVWSIYVIAIGGASLLLSVAVIINVVCVRSKTKIDPTEDRNEQKEDETTIETGPVYFHSSTGGTGQAQVDYENPAYLSVGNQ